MKSARGKASRGSPGTSASFSWLRAVATDAVHDCDAAAAVERACRIGTERLTLGDRSLSLRGGGRIVVVGCGKAAPAMMEGLERCIREAGGRRPVLGIIAAPRERARATRVAGRFRISRLAGEHPVPSRGSFRAGREVLRLLARVRPSDDLIFLVSGGGSAMLAAPLTPFVGTADKSKLHRFNEML